MSAPVSIVIPAFNQLDYVRQCVESVQAGTSHPCRLILVDNGSTDGVGEYFDSVAGAEVVHAPENRGFAGGVNLGLACRAQGHVLLLNSDTVVPQGWLGRLVAHLDADPRLGMTGPMSNYVSGPQQIPGLEFASLDQVNGFARQLAVEYAGQRSETTRLVGFCLLIRDAAYEAVGPFDEEFGIGNYEDDDYSVRVMQAGYRLCIARDSFVFHYGGRTFMSMGITDGRWHELMDHNRELFGRKWGVQAPPRSDAARQAERLNARAREALAAGDRTEALRLLKGAVGLFPCDEVHCNDLGAVLWDIGEAERAFALFLRAVRLKPSYEDARANLLEAGRFLGREDEARTVLGEPADRRTDGH